MLSYMGTYFPVWREPSHCKHESVSKWVKTDDVFDRRTIRPKVRNYRKKGIVHICSIHPMKKISRKQQRTLSSVEQCPESFWKHWWNHRKWADLTVKIYLLHLPHQQSESQAWWCCDYLKQYLRQYQPSPGTDFFMENWWKNLLYHSLWEI